MIVTENLQKSYTLGGSTIHALAGVDLEIPQGQFVAIVGASGSGKSTLMHMLGGLDRPNAGKVWINGENIANLPQNKLASFRNKTMGFVFQQFQLMPRQSALKNVMLPLSYRRPPHPDAAARAEAALTQVGLGDRLRNRPTQLSGGQQQRVAIARALVGDPSLLLADEPTGALDSHTSSEIMHLFKSLGAHGLTILLITHDMQIAAHAERVIRMVDGQIVEDTLTGGHA